MTHGKTKRLSKRKRRKTLRKTPLQRRSNKIKKIFKDVPWAHISDKEEEKFKKNKIPSTYGYLEPEGVMTMLKGINKSNKVFYDLGSGVGRPAVSACILYPQLKKIVGIEFSEKRIEMANEILKKLPKQCRSKIKYMQGDILDKKYNYKHANIIWISSLCFSTLQLKKLADKFNKETKKGTFIFSSSILDIPRAKDLEPRKVKQSWGDSSDIYCYKIDKN